MSARQGLTAEAELGVLVQRRLGEPTIRNTERGDKDDREYPDRTEELCGDDW